METEVLLKYLGAKIKDFQSLKAIITKINKLDQNPFEDLDKIRANIKKLEKILRLEEKDEIYQSISEWLKEYKTKERQYSEELKKRFGIEFEKELKQCDLLLTGHYPKFKVWMFVIEVNVDKFTATIWYGPKQEKLESSSLIPSKIAKRLAEIKNKLGSKIDKDELFEKLKEAYIEVSQQFKQKEVPILEVKKEFSLLLQKEKYSRADFSYDLFRLKDNKNLKLRVAARAYTKTRKDFLWIPSNEKGEGYVYSHIQIEVN